MRLLLFYFVVCWSSVTAQVGHFDSDRKINVSTISGFADAQAFYTGDNTGPQANTTAFSAWVVFVSQYNFVATLGHIFGKGNGWHFVEKNGSYTFDVGGNWGDDPVAPNRYQTPGVSLNESNYITVLHGVVRNNVMYMYKNGKPTGVGVAITNTTFISTTTGISFGTRNPASGGDKAVYPGRLLACGIASSTGLTDAQVEAHYQALIADNPLAQATGTTHLWRAQDAGATWVDVVAGLSATRTGSIAPVTEKIAFYKRFDPSWDYTSTNPILPPLSNTVGGMDVMCIGDSRSKYHTYRYICHLNAQASSDMNNLRWVGPQQYNVNFPDNSHAWDGTAAGNILRADVGSIPNLTTTLNTYDPDICVLWFGHNALEAVGEVPLKGDFLELIRAIHTVKPNCRFLILSEIGGKQEAPSMDGKFQEYSNWVQRTLQIQMVREGMQVRLCWIYNTLDPTDFLDTVHPIQPSPIGDIEGYNKVGVKVWPALRLVAGYTN